MRKFKIVITTIFIAMMVTSCGDLDRGLMIDKTPNDNVRIASYNKDEYADEVLRLVNIQRLERGLSELTTTQGLRNAADYRASEIVTLFDHERPGDKEFYTVLEEFRVPFMVAGENIAYRQSTPEEVVTAWMNSEGHKENIISDSFNKMGVGLYLDEEGYIAWVQLFTD